ncbi:MAG: GAF domain-containing protein [Thermoanaerobaculia bacterium]|nr:GAF domain-containing protein [Thermoanaerobaculia bacterium]
MALDQVPASRLELLRELSNQLASACTLEAMFKAALDPLLAGVRIDRAALLLFDGEGVMRFRMWQGLSEEYRRTVEGHSPWRFGEKNARPICIEDAETAPEAAELREVFRREGIRALGFFPLIWRGELIGKFMLYADRPTRWDRGEIAFVETVASSVAVAVALTQTEQTLSFANSQLASLAENVPAGIMFVNPEGLIQYSNERFSQLFELAPAAELRGRSCVALADSVLRLFKDPESFLGAIAASHSGDQPGLGREFELVDERTFAQDYVPVRADGRLVGHLWSYTDVSERKRMEQQLIQTQRLDGLGSLAGSVAHDFNNLLTPILGYGEILREQITSGAPHLEIADELIFAAERAAAVTQQLLAFARHQPVSPEVVDLRLLLHSSFELLRRLLGPSIQLVVVDQASAPFVRIDPTQLQQVLINLVANARDAMPDGGELRLELSQETLAKPARHSGLELAPGAYVVLTARDTGCGMDGPTLRRVSSRFSPPKKKGGARVWGSRPATASCARAEARSPPRAHRARAAPSDSSCRVLGRKRPPPRRSPRPCRTTPRTARIAATSARCSWSTTSPRYARCWSRWCARAVTRPSKRRTASRLSSCCGREPSRSTSCSATS